MSLQDHTEPTRPAPLADLLRERTRTLHAQAERSGILAELLRGRGGRGAYALLLRNLLAAYGALEAGLARHRDNARIARLFVPELLRAPALEADLGVLAGPRWAAALPLLPAGERYAARIETAADGDGIRLAAHAYVRYLGDLNGGQVVRGVLARALGLADAGLSFYSFPGIADLGAFRTAYREALDRAGDGDAARALILDEALEAFRLNIALSEAVMAAAD